MQALAFAVKWKPTSFLVILCLTVLVFAPMQDDLSKARIRVIYCGDGHYFRNFVENVFKTSMRASVETVIDVQDPDLVVGSTGDQCLQFSRAKRLIILGENIGNERFEYLNEISAISTIVLHCTKYSVSSNMYYFPFWVTSFGERRVHTPEDLIKKSKRQLLQVFKSKSKFCAFMYSHASSGRDQILQIVSSYKKVDYLGPYPGNSPAAIADRHIYEDNVTFYDLSVEHYEPYKFVIAGENSQANGYVTEKIVSVMLANSIPIYFGAPDIAQHFNPKSFINANNLSKSELLSTIRLLNENEKAYLDMLQQPWFVGNKLPDWFRPGNLTFIFQKLLRDSISEK